MEVMEVTSLVKSVHRIQRKLYKQKCFGVIQWKIESLFLMCVWLWSESLDEILNGNYGASEYVKQITGWTLLMIYKYLLFLLS